MMKPEETTIHIWDASHPDDEENTFPIYVRSPIVPRVGDHVLYWVDYPKHKKEQPWEENEPARVSGTVARVEIEFRRMRWGPGQNDITMVSIYLDGYKAEMPDAG